jgi:transposase InsO family protein
MVQACADAGLRRSMGATGICWDNSGAESLWSTFKHEHHYRHVFAAKAELVAAVDKWIPGGDESFDGGGQFSHRAEGARATT